jgi:hypothetical protein
MAADLAGFMATATTRPKKKKKIRKLLCYHPSRVSLTQRDSRGPFTALKIDLGGIELRVLSRGSIHYQIGNSQSNTIRVINWPPAL